MTAAAPVGCARCATILSPNFRFCPECGLPASGETVMSTEIAAQRRLVERTAERERDPRWRRYLLPVSATGMLMFVVALGLVLFNRHLLNRLLPPPTARDAHLPHTVRWEPEWVAIPPGRFAFGNPEEGRLGEIPYGYSISKYEVPNSLWFDYVTAERTRIESKSLWQESFPRRSPGWSVDVAGNPQLASDRRSYPVTNVSPVAIAEFCAWLTRRLNVPGWEIRIPTRLEWEYAARGQVARTYTWGNGDVELPIPKQGGAMKVRAGIRGAVYAVNDAELREEDTSPFKVVGMGTNVAEWNVWPDFGDLERGAPELEETELLPISVLPRCVREKTLRVARRGASFGCDLELARRRARPSWYVLDEPTNLLDDAGIRLVKVKAAK